MSPIDPFLPRRRIAYFSMEIALRPELHTCSGGLGVLPVLLLHTRLEHNAFARLFQENRARLGA